MADFNEFCRKLRCKYHFNNGEGNITHPFWRKSGYKPEFANNAIETYIFKTKLELDNMKPMHSYDNLSLTERRALSALKQNRNFVIRKADKNNTTVIWDKAEYIDEGMRQLNSATHFVEINQLNVKETHTKITAIITEMYNKGFVDKISYKYLSTKINDKPGRLYLLPKLHKIKPELIEHIQKNPDLYKEVKLQGRPIVSLSGTILERVGKYLDTFLLPAVRKQTTYLRDSLQLINILEETKVSLDAFLVTFDIKEMYNNLSHQEMIEAVKHAWPIIIKAKHDIPLHPLKYILDLLKIVLENNEFTFNN